MQTIDLEKHMNVQQNIELKLQQLQAQERRGFIIFQQPCSL